MIHRILPLFLFLFTFVAAAAPVDSLPPPDSTRAPAPAMRDTVHYEADFIEYDAHSRIIRMRGTCVVKNKKMTLFADTIHFLLNDDLLLATGSPQLFESGDTVVGESMTYNIKTSRGRVKTGTAHSGAAKYTGRQLARSDDRNFYMADGAYSSCIDEEDPHYFFYSRDIKVIPNDKAVSRPLVLDIAGAPVLALPYFVLPLTQGRKSGFLRPQWWGSPSSRASLDNLGYYWAFNDYTDLTLSAKIDNFSTYVLKGNARYALRYPLTGGIGLSYTLATPEYGQYSKQWALNYYHDQRLLPDGSFRLAGRGDIASTRSYYKTFTEDTTRLVNQQVNANLALTKSFAKINASSSINWDRRHDFRTDEVTQTLPSISFALSPRPLIPMKEAVPGDSVKERFYNRITWSWSANAISRSNTTSGKDSTVRVTRPHSGAGHNLSVSTSQTLFKWFTLSPNFSLRQSIFDAWIDTTRIPDTMQVPVYDTLDHYPSLTSIDFDTTVLDTFISATNDTTYKCRVGTKATEFFRYDTIQYNRYDPLNRFSNQWTDKAMNYSWSAGVSLSTRLYGLFPVRLFGMNGIRHTLTPSVGYTFTPKKDMDHTYPNLGIAYATATKQNQGISLTLDNLFQGKTAASADGKRPEKKFNIVNARASSSYIFSEDTSGRKAFTGKWSDIGVSASTGIPVLDISYSASFRPYDEHQEIDIPNLMQYTLSFRPKSISLAGNIWNGDRTPSTDTAKKNVSSWNMSMAPSYNFTKSRASLTEDFKTRKDFNLVMNAGLHFTKNWSTSWSGYYNFTTERLESNTINFVCDLECWDMRFNWRPSGYNPGFYFSVAIKKHPEIKWEERD